MSTKGQTVGRVSPASIPSQPRSTSNRLRSDRPNIARRTRDTALLSVIVTPMYVRNKRCHEIMASKASDCGDRARKISRNSARRRRAVPATTKLGREFGHIHNGSSKFIWKRTHRDFHQTWSHFGAQDRNRATVDREGLIDHASQDLWTTPSRFKITM